MLKIKNLTVVIDDDNLLDAINLDVNKGEIHAIMGPKKSGKSSLVHAILGNPNMNFKEGYIKFNKKSILENSIEERNLLGIFTSFQYPPEIDGVSNFEIVKAALKTRKDSRTDNQVEKEYKTSCSKLGLSSDHGIKNINHSLMTDTECKKNEVLQMLMLNPSLVILDEIDEDVDESELESVALNIKEFLADKSKAAIIITHSKALLDILEPTHVHIMVDGEIKEQGSADLYKRIVEDGYSQFSQS